MNKFRTKHNRTWEVLEAESLDDGASQGHCRPQTRQIIISKKAKNKWSTFVHECIHAIDIDYQIGLTETQVLKLEEAIVRSLKLNKIYDYWKKMDG